jgi:heptosyltransferase-3
MSDPEKEKIKTLIIRPSGLGDTLLLAPALSQLSHKVEFTLVGRRPAIDFLFQFVNDCLDYEKGGWHTLFSEKPRCEILPFQEVHKVISFLSDSDGYAEKGLRKCLKQIPLFSFPPFPPKGEKIHVAHYLALCLNKSGLPVNPDKAIEEAKRGPLLGENRPVRTAYAIVLHPGSGGERKNYPPEFWLRLLKNMDLEVFKKRILLLGPAESGSYQLFSENLSDLGVEIRYSPPRDTLLSLLKGASLYIGHDSGITHLAAMLGTPTVAFFRESDPLQWAPLGPDVTVITNDKSWRVIFGEIRKRIAGMGDILSG